MTHGARLVVSVLVLVGALLFMQLRSSGEAVPARKPLGEFPLAVGDWQGREATIFEPGILDVLKSSDYVMRRYVDGTGRSLWLFVGYWATQRKGAQPHSPQNCLPGGGWEPLDFARVPIQVGGGGTITVNRFLIQKDRDQQMVLYWYQAQGKPVAGEVAARVEMVKNAVLRNRTDGALVRVTSPVYGSAAETTAMLVRYVQAMYPVLGEYLPD